MPCGEYVCVSKVPGRDLVCDALALEEGQEIRFRIGAIASTSDRRIEWARTISALLQKAKAAERVVLKLEVPQYCG